jgi:hypothetical protein
METARIHSTLIILPKRAMCTCPRHLKHSVTRTNSTSGINGPSKPTSAPPRNRAYSAMAEKHSGHSSTTSMKISPSRVMMGRPRTRNMSLPHILTLILTKIPIIPPWWSRECPCSGATTIQPSSARCLSLSLTGSMHDPKLMILSHFHQDKHPYHSCIMIAMPSTNSSPPLALQTVLISYFRLPKSLMT